MRKKWFKRGIIISLILIALSIGLIKFLFPTGANEAPDDNGLSTTTIERPTYGKIEDYSYNEILYIAAWVIENASSFEAHTEGTATAKSLGITVNQSINDMRLKQNGLIFTQAISYSSMAKVGEQRYFTDEFVLLRKGKVTSSTEATWKDSVKSFTIPEFEEEYGCYANSIHKYILNDITILSSKFDGINEDGNYVYSYDIDPILGPSKFSREVKHMSSSSIYPTFEYAKISLTITKDFLPVSVRTQDRYDVKSYGLDATTSNDMTEYFDSINSKETKLPYMDFFGPYLDGKEANGSTNDKKEVTDYLAYGFSKYLTSKSQLAVNLEIDDKVYEADVIMNLLKMDISVLFDNGYSIRYKDDMVYILFDEFKCYLNIDEILDNLDTSSESNNNFSFDDVLNNCIINDDGKNIHIIMPINLDKIEIDVNFYMHYDNEKIVFDSIDASISYGNFNANINLEPTIDIKNSPSVDDAKLDLTNTYTLINPIMNLASSKSVSISGNINLRDNDYVNIDGLINNGNLKLMINYNENIINLYYFEKSCYLDYNNIKIKIDDSELINYLNLIVSNKEMISNIDLSKILQSLKIYENLLSLKIDLSEIDNSLSNLDLNIKNIDDTKLLIESIDYNSSILISPTDTEFSINPQEYVNLTGIIPVEEIINIINNDQINIAIEETNIDGLTIKGNIDAIISEKYLFGSIYINDNLINFSYQNELLYLSHEDICFTCCIDDIAKYVDIIINKFDNKNTTNITINNNPNLNIIVSSILNLSIYNENDIIYLVENNLGLNIDIKNSSITKRTLTPTITYKDAALLLDNLFNYIDAGYIISTIDNKEILLDNNSSISYHGSLSIDIMNMKLKGIFNVIYKDNSNIISLNDITIFVENNILYIEYGNTKLSGEITEVIALINSYIKDTKFDFDLIYNEVLNLIINDINTNITTENENILIQNEYLNMTLSTGKDFDIIKSSKYENIICLEPTINMILSILNEKSVKLDNINTDILLGETLISISNSYINIDFNNGLLLDSTLNINVDNMGNTFYIQIINNYIYISYEDRLAYRLHLNEIDDLITIINEKFDTNIDLSTKTISIEVKDLINNLTITDSLNIDLNLSTYIPSLKSIKVSLNEKFILDSLIYNDTSIDNTSLNIIISKFNYQSRNVYYKGYTDIVNLISYVDEIMTLAKNESFNLSYSFTVGDYKYPNKNDINTYTLNERKFSGNLNFKIFEDGSFDFRLTSYLEENVYSYTNGASTLTTSQTHTIDFNVIDNMFYCTYYSDKGSYDNRMKLKIDLPTIIRLVKTLGDTFSIDIPFIDAIENIESLDTSMLDSIKPEIDTTKEIRIASFIKDLYATETEFGLTLDKDALGFNDNLTIKITKDNNKINSLSLSGIVDENINDTTIHKVTCNNIMITLINEEFDEIVTPSDSNLYDDFSSLDDFLSNILETAKLKDQGFNITGTAKMTFNSSFLNNIIEFLKDLPDINLDILVSLDENDNPLVYIKISNIKKLKLLFDFVSIFEADTTTEIYYYNNMLYINRTINPNSSNPTSEKRMYSLNYFTNNVINEVVYIFNFGHTIQDAILNAEADPNYPRRLDTVYKKYSSNDTSYYTSLSGAHLIEGKEMGDLNLTFTKNSNNQLAYLSGNVEFVSIITLDLNLELIKIGEIVFILPPNKDEYLLID